MIKKTSLCLGLFLLLSPLPSEAQERPAHIAPSITDEELRELRERVDAEITDPESYETPEVSDNQPAGEPGQPPSSEEEIFKDRDGLKSSFSSERSAAKVNNLRADGKQLKKKRDQKADRFAKLLGRRGAGNEELIKAYQELAALNSELDQKRLEFILANREKDPYWSPKTFKQIEREFTDHKVKARAN